MQYFCLVNSFKIIYCEKKNWIDYNKLLWKYTINNNNFFIKIKLTLIKVINILYQVFLLDLL